MKRQLLGDRNFYRALFAIGIPIALQNLLSTTATMVDTAMVGTQGELAVAAVGLSSQYASLLFSAYFGFAAGGGLFFSQYWGAKNDKGICKAYGLTIVCMMIVGFIFAAAAIFAPQFVLGIYTDKAAIREVGQDYLRIIGYAFPFQVLSMGISMLLRSTEQVRIPLVAAIASTLTNIVVNWVLIFGKLGFPAMGVAGAAVGTLCSSIVNALMLYLLSMRDPHSFLTRVKDHFGWDGPLVKNYFIKSAPIIANEMLYGVGQMIINVVIGRQNEAAIAAMAVFRVIEGLFFAFFGGFANSCSVVVGKAVGSGAHEDGLRDAKRFVWLCPAFTFCLSLIVLSARIPLLSLFGLEGASLRYGEWMLAIYVIASTVRMCNYITNSAFRAGGDSYYGTIFELGGLFLLAVPAVCLTGLVWKLPFLAVFAMVYLDEPIRLVILLRHLVTARWIKPVTDLGRAALAEFRANHHLTPDGKRMKNA